MKKNILMFFVLAGLYACQNKKNNEQEVQLLSEKDSSVNKNDFMYQYSIMDALLAGVYDGDLNIGQLKEHGDFAIGGFNTLDGEMIMIDGKTYKARYNETVETVADTVQTPLAFTKFFKADTAIIIDDNTSFKLLQQKLGATLNKNEMYAIKLTGSFVNMDARSEKPASKPYPELAPYLHNGAQVSFQFANIEGTCVGFLLPAYIERTNVPGFHFHFISNDRTKGGHVFDFNTAGNLKIEIDKIQGYTVELNTNAGFDRINLEKNRSEELKTVE